VWLAYFCCCNDDDDDDDDDSDDDDDDDDDESDNNDGDDDDNNSDNDDDDDDHETLTVSYCILVLSGPQYPAQHMVLQCMMESCGYLLVMMGMLDSMICGPSHCW
jgi:hypothetical protein